MKKALMIVDHGSVFAAANDQLAAVAGMVRDRDHGFDIVLHAHMELAHPDIAEAFRDCVRMGAGHITVCPYFLAPGRHSTTDIPALVTAAAARHPGVAFTITEPLGLSPNLIDLVLERTMEAADKP